MRKALGILAFILLIIALAVIIIALVRWYNGLKLHISTEETKYGFCTRIQLESGATISVARRTCYALQGN